MLLPGHLVIMIVPHKLWFSVWRLVSQLGDIPLVFTILAHFLAPSLTRGEKRVSTFVFLLMEPTGRFKQWNFDSKKPETEKVSQLKWYSSTVNGQNSQMCILSKILRFSLSLICKNLVCQIEKWYVLKCLKKFYTGPGTFTLNTWFGEDQHGPVVGWKLSTKVDSFFGSSATNQLLEWLPHWNSQEEGYLDSFSEIVCIHTRRSLRGPPASFGAEYFQGKKVKMLTSSGWIISRFQFLNKWKLVLQMLWGLLWNPIYYRGAAAAALVQEKVIDSITALSYILPHLFNPPFQSENSFQYCRLTVLYLILIFSHASSSALYTGQSVCGSVGGL